MYREESLEFSIWRVEPLERVMESAPGMNFVVANPSTKDLALSISQILLIDSMV